MSLIKADKGQIIDLVNRNGHNNFLEQLFTDLLSADDPTLRNLSTVKSCTFYYRKKITLENKDTMRPTLAQVGRAHGLSKIHKDYEHLSLVCLIIDTTNTAHYSTVK